MFLTNAGWITMPAWLHANCCACRRPIPEGSQAFTPDTTRSGSSLFYGNTCGCGAKAEATVLRRRALETQQAA